MLRGVACGPRCKIPLRLRLTLRNRCFLSFAFRSFLSSCVCPHTAQLFRVSERRRRKYKQMVDDALDATSVTTASSSASPAPPDLCWNPGGRTPCAGTSDAVQDGRAAAATEAPAPPVPPVVPQPSSSLSPAPAVVRVAHGRTHRTLGRRNGSNPTPPEASLPLGPVTVVNHTGRRSTTRAAAPVTPHVRPPTGGRGRATPSTRPRSRQAPAEAPPPPPQATAAAKPPPSPNPSASPETLRRSLRHVPREGAYESSPTDLSPPAEVSHLTDGDGSPVHLASAAAAASVVVELQRWLLHPRNGDSGSGVAAVPTFEPRPVPIQGEGNRVSELDEHEDGDPDTSFDPQILPTTVVPASVEDVTAADQSFRDSLGMEVYPADQTLCEESFLGSAPTSDEGMDVSPPRTSDFVDVIALPEAIATPTRTRSLAEILPSPGGPPTPGMGPSRFLRQVDPRTGDWVEIQVDNDCCTDEVKARDCADGRHDDDTNDDTTSLGGTTNGSSTDDSSYVDDEESDDDEVTDDDEETWAEDATTALQTESSPPSSSSKPRPPSPSTTPPPTPRRCGCFGGDGEAEAEAAAAAADDASIAVDLEVDANEGETVTVGEYWCCGPAAQGQPLDDSFLAADDLYLDEEEEEDDDDDDSYDSGSEENVSNYSSIQT